MDEETLALLGSDTDEATPAPEPDVIEPSDLGKPETETPETLIARGIIPEGYTKDAKTGEIRLKKTRGRPRRTGSPPPAHDAPITRTPDEAPDSKARGAVAKGTPRYQKGVIAAGMTKLYKRAGRIIKAMDSDIGTAVIESAEDCGEAWDELARTNPRVRAFLMRLISGGAWGSVIMAHLPILLAVIMKEGIRKRIPFGRFLDVMVSDDDEEEGSNPFADFMGNMTEDDMSQMMQLGMQMMNGQARRVPGTVYRGGGEE